MKKILCFAMTALLGIVVVSTATQTMMGVEEVVSCSELSFCDCDVPQIIPDEACTDFNGRARQIAWCGEFPPLNLCTTNVVITCP